MKTKIKYLVERSPVENDYFKWLVTTQSGFLLGSFRFRKYAEKYKKILKKEGILITRKYSPYGKFGLIHVSNKCVCDGLEAVIYCTNEEKAIALAECFREAKGNFILNGPFDIGYRENEK